MHQNTYHGGQNYYLRIRARINQIPGADSNDVIATVYFGQSTTSTSVQKQNQMWELIYEEEIQPESATLPKNIKAYQFPDNSYVDIVIPFTKIHTSNWGNEKLKIDIEWKDTRDLYIDNISIYNRYYDSLFVQAPSVQTSIRNRIKSEFVRKFSARAANSLWAHPYHDEAMPFTYRCFKTVSDLAELPDVLGTGKYVNGVTNSSWFTYDEMRFAYNIRRVPYVLYDQYPIEGDVDSVSTNPSPGKITIQNAFDRLINFNYGTNPIRGEIKNGLRYSIDFAQNHTP
ncbi:MAG: hypothetical protein FJW56_04580, partial [Actinobacteria bacterium]|nr:hypothetical protein [Actinomycetota bacterium]